MKGRGKFKNTEYHYAMMTFLIPSAAPVSWLVTNWNGTAPTKAV